MKTTNKTLFEAVSKQSKLPTKTAKPTVATSMPLQLGEYTIGIDKLFTNSTASAAKDNWVVDRTNFIAYHRNKLP